MDTTLSGADVGHVALGQPLANTPTTNPPIQSNMRDTIFF